jgi:hypothetical protein
MRKREYGTSLTPMLKHVSKRGLIPYRVKIIVYTQQIITSKAL